MSVADSKSKMAIWDTKDIDSHYSDPDERFNEKTYRNSNLVIASGMYAVILIVLGAVFPITYFVSNGKRSEDFYLSIFHIYLYMGSLVFLVYAHMKVMYYKRRLRHIDVNMKMRNKCNGAFKNQELKDKTKPYSLDNDSDNTVVIGSRVRKGGTMGTMEKLAFEGLEPQDLPVYYAVTYAPFFLRLGIVVFGLGCVVLDGFRLVQFAHSKGFWQCYGLPFLIQTALRLIFVFALTFFIFKNHKIVLNFRKHIVRLGFLHTIVTTLCIYFLSLVMETAESYHRMGLESNNSVENSNSVENGKYLEEEPRCFAQRVLADFASPYLYPCVVQFVLIAASVLWRCLRNIGGPSQYADDNESNPMDCHKATTGLFVGLLLIIASVIAVCFFLLYNPENSTHPMAEKAPLLVYVTVDIISITCAIICCILTFIQIRKIPYKGNQEFTLKEILLFLGLVAVYAVLAFQIIPTATLLSYRGSLYDGLQVACALITFIQATLQVLLIIDAQRRKSVERSHYKNKPGRSLLTFLLICNVCLWLLRTFEWKVAADTDIFRKFYGGLTWIFVINMLLPLTVFFRFHSIVCISQIWVDAYKKVL